jgi:diguanylate cyclase (GGDEF)-like protein/putative nucleotidyltransferase with HDIG domain
MGGRVDHLREQALAAAEGLFEGEQALVSVLRDIEREKDRAADAYRAVVHSLAAALEARDGYTGNHSDEVQRLAVAVARKLGLERDEVQLIRTVALLHDIGKIGIPDSILHKPARLEETEWQLMREHPAIGERILRPLPGLTAVATAVRHEHERWDGLGYPDGLAGEGIPLASRVVLACDAWHALVSDRPYRKALPVETALEELRACAGTQFDPRVVGALIECVREPLPTAEECASDPVIGADSRAELELRALVTVAAAVAAAHALDEVIEIAAEEARRALGASTVSISQLDPERTLLRTLINVGDLTDWEERRPENEVYVLADYPHSVAMFERGTPHLTSLVDGNADAAEKELLEGLGKVSAMAVPVAFQGEPWGELYATRAHGEEPFTDRDVRFLQTISRQIGGAIGRAELFTGMAELAYTDSLTGLANRRVLDERLEEAVAAAVESGEDLALVLCDLDNLKEINDLHGHQAGDDALRRAGHALGETVPESDRGLVARIGGDEFCVLLAGHSADDARAVVERAVQRLAASGEPRLTLSCGIASIGVGARRAADLVRAADAAQYLAKRTGRRRVCVARPHDVIPQASPGPRRALRDRDAAVQHRLLEDGLERLDAAAGRMLGPQERLELVAETCAAALKAPAWALSFRPGPARSLTTVQEADPRGLFGVEDETYELDAYPLTRQILDEGGAFVVVGEDLEADAAERRLLESWSLTAVLAAATPAGRDGWLLELYADDATLDLHGAVAGVRMLVAEAVRGAAARADATSRARLHLA